ncbi:MAG: DUF433 domain-containing protein [Dehalococcoidia bacterium]|nr:DUF433 domain-containing protein [Dehalococcoidia bacterium]MDW8119038.1 DUF433 domain-containing protein [Chloroflexota bacterium]
METFAGVYFIPEVARYLWATGPEMRRPSYRSLLRWITSGLLRPLATTQSGRERWVTFEDLISLRMLVALRQAGFSLQHIRRVHAWLEEASRYPRPFALQDLWLGETEIFIQMEQSLVSASREGQYAFEIVRAWLRHLPRLEIADMAFERKVNGKHVASRWRPCPGIVLDPQVQFGSPCIESTRIPTSAVWSMVRAGDSEESVARAYGIPLHKVQAAVEWEKRLAKVS